MSIETVKARCIKNTPEVDIEELDKHILKEAARFERAAKVNFNAESGGMFRFSENRTKAKNEYFEKHKLYYIHQYLGYLNDLFDYKAE